MDPQEISNRLKNLASGLEESPDKDALSKELNRILASIEMTVVRPAGALIHQLSLWLNAKYVIDATYRSFADRVRGPWRDSLAAHWYEHAEDERKSSYALAMKIIALGADPMMGSIEIPQCPANLQAMCSVLAGLEIKAIENAYATMELASGDETIRILAEDIMLKDSHHLDDLIRLCSDVP